MSKGSHRRRPERKVTVHGLCSTCDEAQIREDDRGEKVVRCYAFKQFIETAVTRCTCYTQRNSLSKYEMECIAAVIDKNRRSAGFHLPGTQEHKRIIEED